MAVDGKRFLESNASSIPETYFRLGQIKVPRIEEVFDSRNLLPSTALWSKTSPPLPCKKSLIMIKLFIPFWVGESRRNFSNTPLALYISICIICVCTMYIGDKAKTTPSNFIKGERGKAIFPPLSGLVYLSSPIQIFVL